MTEGQEDFQDIDPETDEAEGQDVRPNIEISQSGGEAGAETDTAVSVIGRENPWKAPYDRMQKDIRGWGWSSLVLGVIHLISFGMLDPSWGISLFAVGALSFIISEASMFVIYAAIMAWVGVSNILSIELGTWTFFGVLQVYWSYTLYRKFQMNADMEAKYLDYEQEHGRVQEGKTQLAQKYFSGAGCLLSAAGVGGVLAVFLALVGATIFNLQAVDPDNLGIYDMVWGVFFASGIIGFSLSVAAVVAKYKPLVLAWGGLAAGSILILFQLYLMFVA